MRSTGFPPVLEYQRDLRLARRASRIAERSGVAAIVNYRGFTAVDRHAAKMLDAFADAALDEVIGGMPASDSAAAMRPVVATLLTIDADRGG